MWSIEEMGKSSGMLFMESCSGIFNCAVFLMCAKQQFYSILQHSYLAQIYDTIYSISFFQ